MGRIDGTAIAKEIRTQLAKAVDGLTGRKPGLAVLLVGEDAASETYVANKRRAAHNVGIRSTVIRRPVTIGEEELLQEIDRLNADHEIDGILVQLPLPPHISSSKVIKRIDPAKDVDGFHPINMGKLLIGEEDGFLPCTPYGIHEMLIRSHINPEGKHVVVLGRSNIVGKPLAALLMQKRPTCNATVTLVHSRTKDLKAICREADILVAAIGRPKFVTADMVKGGAVVIDVGINRVDAPQTSKGYKLVGDVDMAQVEEKASLISPVPGGVGPMTVAMLLQNTWTSYCRKEMA
jgi:methylenetetrahydrofolate dehydrogenase (NADP+) / methenyltetrahydrofolate cyclohydrolase